MARNSPKTTLGAAAFDRDAACNHGYGYTTEPTLSSVLATSRSSTVVQQLGRFSEQTVLDMGAGDGFYSIQYWDATRPRRLVALDAAPAAIRVARTRSAGRGLMFVVGDAHLLPFADDSFDLVLIQSILHHVDDPLGLISEALRLASVVLIHEPNGNNPALKIIERVSTYHREHGEKSYTTAALRRWVRQAGGRVVEQRFVGLVPMFCPDWIARVTKWAEPVVERLPVVRLLVCAVCVQRVVRAQEQTFVPRSPG